MYYLVTVLIYLVCIILILIVLVQNSKGGGLASNFSASNQMMGVRKTADFLEKATWALGGALMLFSIVASLSINRGGQEQQSIIQERIDEAIDPTQATPFPTTMPEQQEDNSGQDNQE